MGQVLVADSFMDDERTVSYYDLAFPLFKMAADGTPTSHVGTCFPIGVGVYLTAAHNFDGFQEARGRYKRMGADKTAPTLDEMAQRLRWMKEDRFLEGADVNCGALILDQAAIRKGELKLLGFSKVSTVLMTYDFDMAVLLIKDDIRRNPDGGKQPIACFSLIENPEIGQKIVVAGFPGTSVKFEITEKNGKPFFSFGLSMTVNDGEITKKYPVMRDLGHAFFPCMQTDAEIAPGHSGGPVICTETLSVVGINSIGGIAGGMISWVGKALDAELVTPAGMTIWGKPMEPDETTTLRKLAAAGVFTLYDK